jgi:hypothetical protein
LHGAQGGKSSRTPLGLHRVRGLQLPLDRQERLFELEVEAVVDRRQRVLEHRHELAPHLLQQLVDIEELEHLLVNADEDEAEVVLLLPLHLQVLVREGVLAAALLEQHRADELVDRSALVAHHRARAWGKQVLSARGLERVGRKSEYAI